MIFINTDLILPFNSSFFLNDFFDKLVICLNIRDLITLSVESNRVTTLVIYQIGDTMPLLVNRISDVKIECLNSWQIFVPYL